jgi:hypothetical protein
MKLRTLGAGLLALSLCLAIPATAAAGPLTGQTLGASAWPKKQPAKKRAAAGIFVAVDTQYEGTFPYTGKANRTIVDFDNDFVFNPGKLPQCDPNAPGFSASTTEAARAQCGGSIVGAGNATLSGPVAGVTAIVTAFNGTRGPAGEPRVILHSRTSAPLNTTAPLIGTLRNSDAGGDFGKSLDVAVPILPGGFVITHFDTTIPKKVVFKRTKVVKNKKNGKKRKVKIKRFFVSSRCADKNRTWNFGARSSYDTGASTSAFASQKCVPKKVKKKKKKKK